MPVESFPKPLFGPDQGAFFESKEHFCESIVQQLRRSEPDNAALRTGTAVEIVGRMTKSQVINLATKHGIALEILMPKPRDLDQDSVQKVVRMASETYAIDHELPAPEVIAQVILQISALDELTQPPPAWSAKKAEFMAKVHARMQKLKK
jgi:hypothetical protein